MLVPDPKSVGANIRLFNISHAQPDETSSFLNNVNPVSGKHWLVVEEELKLRLWGSGDQSGESSSHSTEDHLITNLLEELRSILSALLNELNNLEGSSRFHGALLVLGHTSVASNVGVLDLLDEQHPLHAVCLDLVASIILNQLSVEVPGDGWPGVASHFADKLCIAVEQLLDAVEGLGEERLRVDLLHISVANSGHRSALIAEVALVCSTVSNLCIHNFQSDKLSIAEEVAAGRIDRLSVLGPGEFRDGVSTNGSCDPQLHALIHRDISERAGKAGLRQLHTLLQPGLDSNVGQ